MRRTPLVLSALLVLPLAGCSAPPSVEQTEVEDRIVDYVEAEFGVVPDGATCPDQIRGEEDQTMTCLVAIAGQELDVEVQVESVDGDSAEDVELRYQLLDVQEMPPPES